MKIFGRAKWFACMKREEREVAKHEWEAVRGTRTSTTWQCERCSLSVTTPSDSEPSVKRRCIGRKARAAFSAGYAARSATSEESALHEYLSRD